jgi:polyphosphate kinase 2 (PPK2 family)
MVSWPEFTGAQGDRFLSYRSLENSPVQRLTRSMNKSSDEPTSIKLKRRDFEKEAYKLHVELVKLQEWVKHKGLRIVVLLEGRDAAGKGGAIKCITERVSPAFSELWLCRLPAIERRRSYMCNAILLICQRPARSCCSIAVGTTARWSNG